ncbi:LysR substrate-binding domain-containing protein [Sphingomonas bacterium]|uniref:LysR substrate-binding domain-containing protein n=1 Tax=Sphingomonas bacterium TaxID=1895847 RepID=UPI0020C71805|nr:LysR substrate-binding domain-containing protein [Sphingomonas bacterium]
MSDADRPLNIATLPSFGMRWLAPRLPALTVAHPEIVISFAARADMFDLAEDGYDAAVHFGNDDWPGAAHDLLFRERAIPVLAPGLLATHPIRSEADFASLPLLSQAARRGAWRDWLAERGIAPPVDPVGLIFEHFLMLAQAAAAGVGAALLPSFLIEPEMAAGTLVAPLPSSTATPGAYWLVYPPDRLDDRRFQRFRDWVLAEARSMTIAS